MEQGLLWVEVRPGAKAMEAPDPKLNVGRTVKSIRFDEQARQDFPRLPKGRL
jgi:hypothetical protein